MPRSGGGVYSLPAGSTIANGDLSDATDLNTPLADIAADLNIVRPIVAGGTGASTAAGARTALGIDITTLQPLDAGLTSIAGLTTAADRMIYTTASDTYAVATLTAAGRAILDDADATAQRATLGLVIGTNVQAQGATLTSLEGLSLVQGDILYATAADTLVRLPKGTAGQALLMNAGATAPEWVTPATAGGATLLGTITTTSGASQSLTSLVLTSYKFLRLVLVGVEGSATYNLSLDGEQIYATALNSETLRGFVEIDLTEGTMWSSIAAVAANNTVTPQSFAGDVAITTASTSVTLSVSLGNFDAGSVRVYGIA